MEHPYTTDRIREIASLHSLGALEDEERETFERHLAEGCRICREEVDRFGRVAGALGNLAPPVQPRPDLRERLLREIERPEKRPGSAGSVQVWRSWKEERDHGDHFLLRSSDGGWEETAVEGVSVRRLFADPAQRSVTMLVRMDPGSSYPPHRHGGPEECYVIEGDLRVGAEVLRAGDYQRVARGSVHGVQSTEGGCTLLIVSSTCDEILE